MQELEFARIHSFDVRSWRTPLAAFPGHRRGVAHLCRAASESPHRILGVAPSASEADVKRAYRKLALKYHPDVNKAPDAQQRFMSIKNAYQALIDSNFHSNDQSTSKVDPFSWGYSTSAEEEPAEFYDLGVVWEDLQGSFVSLWDFSEEFLGDLQASFNKKSAANGPKSLFEELMDIGEEFVEFLEKEFNIIDDIRQVIEDDDTQFESRKGEANINNAKDPSKQARKLEIEIEEIQGMLAKLRQDLGL